MMAVRRKQLSVTGRSEIPAPIPAVPHPGYAPNAAFHAIKRHALEFVNPKELQVCIVVRQWFFFKDGWNNPAHDSWHDSLVDSIEELTCIRHP